MNIHITGDGNINKYYIQTLCLLYFPGEGFKENENGRWCRISTEKSNKRASAFVEIGDERDGISFSGHGEIELSSLVYGDLDKCEKLAAGLAFLEAAGKLTGYTPPWGMLTGVRPARVASALIEAGLSPAEAAEYLCGVYRAAPEKAELAVGVSIAESRLISGDQSSNCSVYIAIPFCPSRCRYCSFVSVSSPGLLRLIPEYLTALKADIGNIAATINSLGLHVKSVYVGGGTPTILEACQIEDLLSYIRKVLGDDIPEFTFEAGRPDTITKDKLSAIVGGGVGRISVNTQTLNDDVLKGIGRNHTAEQFFDAYSLARGSGISKINVDLIAGLPGESADSFITTAKQAADLRPDAVTVHTFTVKRSSDYGLGDLYSRESLAAGLALKEAAEILDGGGYKPYYMYRQKNTVGNLENVGYSLPGCEGLYNIYMMEEVHTVFGAGASAVTRLTLRDKNTGGQYIERIFEPKYPYEYLKGHSGAAGEKRRRALAEGAAGFYKKHG